MSKTTDGFTDRMKSALNRLLRIGTNGPPSSSRRGRRLAPLQELEDRRLLSASPIGGEYRVNTYTAGAQQTFAQTPKAVAMNPANGNYVVVWSSQGQNGGTGYDVYFQRYNAAGVAQGPETLVDTPINGVNQAFANVAMNASGNFVVTWSSQQGGNWNIYAQQYNASGVAQGAAILVDTPGNFDQENSAIAMNASGNFVVTWQAGQNGYWEIYANVFNSSGVSQTGPIQLTSGANNYVVPQVAMDDAGQYVITWLSYAGGINWNVNAELFGSNNQPIGSEFQVNTLTTEDSFPAVAMDATGNFTITWTGAQTGIDNVYARSYFSTGAANGTVFQVGPASIESQAFSSVAFAGDGNPIITWSNEGLGISGWGIYAQQFTPTGTPLGSELHVNTYTLNDQVYSSVAGAADGNFTIVWSSQGEDGSGFGVYGQNFTTGASAGINVAGSTFLVSEDNNVLRINSLTGAVVATYPTGVANDGAIFGPDGSIYVADYANNQILHYNAAGTFLSSFGSADLTTPQALSFGPDGNLYVGNADGAVDKFSPTGTFLGTFIAAGSGGLTNAKAIVWGPNGNAYVSSYFNSEVLEYNGTTGAFIKVFATGSGGFEDIAFGPDGNLYAASYGNNAIYLYNGTTGASLGTFASGSQLDNPFGLSFDPNGNLDVASRSSGTIQVYNGTTRAFLGNLDTGLTNPAYLSTTTSLVTSETGTTATFTVVLTSEPLAPVTINLATSVADEGSLSQSTLTFTPSNWNVAQTVTVTGLDDHIVHGDQTYEITGTATSSDSNYNGLAMAPVYVTNTEADVAGFTVTPTSIQTSMSGASASFSVVMTSEPVAPVTITLNGNPAEGTLSTNTLTFDASNWNVAQSVTVTGQDDPLAGTNVTYQITGTASSGDANYNNLAMTPVTVVNVDTILPGFIVNPTTLTTSQSGTTASFSVALTTMPSGSVTVNLVNGDPTQGSLSLSSLTFSQFNWNFAQTATVTGLNNHIAGGNQTYQITGSATSLDSTYDHLAITPITVTNTQAEVSGFIVTPTTLTTSQAGTSASFTVALTSEPLAPVTVQLAASDPSQGSLSKSSLTFNTTDWSFAQTVTVTGLDDHIAGGNQTYQITGIATSGDASYNMKTMTPVNVTNMNVDIAGVNVTAATGLTTIPGGSASFSVVLTSQPRSNVTVSVSSSNAAAGTVSQSSVTFTAADWNTPQTVTITSPSNPGLVGNQTFTIVVGPAASTDPNYSARSGGDVAVTLQIAPVTLPVAPAPMATSPASTSALTSALLAFMMPSQSSSSSQTSNAGSDSSSARSLAFISATVVSVSTVASNTRSGDPALAFGASTLTAAAATGTNRTSQVFAPIPQSTWRPAQDENALDDSEELPVHSARLRSMLPSLAAGQTSQNDGLLDVLNDDGERMLLTEPGVDSTVLIGTGILAGSGYVLLNSRLGLWLLGLLTAQPLWKQFDPMDVLYAWDDRNRGVDDDDEETLTSLVEE